MSDSIISSTGDDAASHPRCRTLDASIDSIPTALPCPLPQRRHGRFLVQPLPSSPAPSSVRAPSPATKQPGVLAPPPPQQQPASSPSVTERRPSRIIGRFEVSELLPSVKPHTGIDSGATTSTTTSGDNTPQKPPSSFAPPVHPFSYS